jgi:hypothetical protein
MTDYLVREPDPVVTLFGSAVLARPAASLAPRLGPASRAIGALFGSAVLALAAGSLARCFIPPFGDAIGALFGSDVFALAAGSANALPVIIMANAPASAAVFIVFMSKLLVRH